MSVATTVETNVRQAVPFFWVRDIERSVHFYVDGLGFHIEGEWVHGGRLRWCWLELGDAAIMLQELAPDRVPADRSGVGVTICFLCSDAVALWRDFTSRGLSARRPFVGNGMWVTEVADPDGYGLQFESPTDAPEETVFSAEQ